MLSHWIPDRHVFRFGSLELTLTLEEYARITCLSLVGPCARVSMGCMRRQFMTTTGLRRATVLSEVTSGHIMSIDFMVDRFGSSDSIVVFRDDFAISEERWMP